MKWFKRGKVEREVDPMDRVIAAIDEVNAAIAALPREKNRLRPWVRCGNRTEGTMPKLVLGYWDMGRECFVTVYEGK